VLSLPRAARTSALVASGAIAVAGIVAGGVRLAPWLLDPAVPWRVAAPFARGLAAVALEAALLVGWPVGWALAACRFVESGEARVLLALGERPARTVLRLAPLGAALGIVLAGAALLVGSDASAPGRVATELVEQGRASCARATEPTTYSIPFTEMTWLCAPGTPPRLVGRGPGAMHAAVLTAADARIAGDFRSLELDDARLLLAAPPPASPPAGVAAEPTPSVLVHVASLTLRGMPPWAQASTLPAALRALLLAVTAWIAATFAAYAVLRHALRSRLAALAAGALGPCAALGLLRLLERADARPALYTLLPLAACATLAVAAGGSAVLSRLRRRGRTATSNSRV
jgi:hypothetical protein